LEQDRLIEISSVERYIKQKPAGCGADEDLEVAPLGKVDKEGV
jgi:hypothetical protein